MLPSEVIVETVEVALSCPTLVVRFDNALLFTVPVIGYDAAVGVSVTEKIRCTVLFLCPLHYNAVTGHSRMSCMRLYIDALCMARM